MEKEIVIKISENTYKAICKGCMLPPYGENVVNAIKNGTPLKEWLSSFNTDSASICFNKIQELKRECEKE